MTYLYIIGFAILILGLIVTFIIARRQQDHEMDKSMSTAANKHRILANPGFIAYASIIVLGILIIGFYLFKHSQ